MFFLAVRTVSAEPTRALAACHLSTTWTTFLLVPWWVESAGLLWKVASWCDDRSLLGAFANIVHSVARGRLVLLLGDLLTQIVHLVRQSSYFFGLCPILRSVASVVCHPVNQALFYDVVLQRCPESEIFGHSQLVQVISKASKPGSLLQAGQETGTSCSLVSVAVLLKHVLVAFPGLFELFNP